MTDKPNLSGLSFRMCPSACNAEGCVISGKFYCAHPNKGGLHQSEMLDPATLNRRDHAKAELERQAAEAKIVAMRS